MKRLGEMANMFPPTGGLRFLRWSVSAVSALTQFPHGTLVMDQVTARRPHRYADERTSKTQQLGHGGPRLCIACASPHEDDGPRIPLVVLWRNSVS